MAMKPPTAIPASAVSRNALALIAVSGTSDFWTHQGFVAQDAPKLTAKLASYDPDARLMLRMVSL